MKQILEKIKADARYAEGVAYGIPRPGHAEGSVRNHLADLDKNLEKLKPLISDEEYWKLAVLIHTHDTFKYAAVPDSPIISPMSHASLARKFFEEFSGDIDLAQMIQFHDEGLALYKQFEASGKFSEKRLHERVLMIDDLELFLLFTIIDGFTPSKDPAKIRWFADVVNQHVLTPRVYRALELFGI